MTTTPIGPAPVAVADPNASGTAGAAGAASDGGTGGDAFVALVQALLDAGPTPQPPGAVTPAAAGAPASAAADDPVAREPDAELPGPLDPALLPGVVPALVAGLVAPIPVPSPAAGSANGPACVPAGDAASAPSAPSAVVGVAASGAPVLPLTTPAGAAGTHAQPIRPAAIPQQATPDADASIASTTAPGPQPDRGTSKATAGTGADALPTSSPTVPVGATVAPAASVAAPATTVTNPVAHQVFPEIVRLTTSSDGPQRVTIRLNPESLGEVRVVLTQRQGGLEVSLSAGTEARRALAEGTPELQRLLDAVGRSDARIVIRDGTGLPVASTASAGTSSQAGVQQSGAGTQWSTDLSGGAWNGAGHGGGEATAGHGRSTTPGSSNATDGIPDATAPSRRPATVTGARPGLDVTM